jgi:hypothetical protein
MAGIRNAPDFAWSDNSPNWLTYDRLNEVIQNTLNSARTLGLHTATVYWDCPNPRHHKKSLDGQYLCELNSGEIIKQWDSRFIWCTNIFDGQIIRKCPCSRRNLPASHSVTVWTVASPDQNQRFFSAVSNAIYELIEARKAAKDRGPRSGIREHLLLAILHLNDALLPHTMDDYIRQLDCTMEPTES